MTLRLVRDSPLIQGPTDDVLSTDRSELYPKQAWYGIALFLVIVGLFNWPLIIYSKFSRSRGAVDTEKLSADRTTGTIALRRLPIALTNAFRVVAFRWTLDIGATLTLNAAEISLTVAYIVYIYVWLFIFSK
jgi:ferric-chelate reductase